MIHHEWKAQETDHTFLRHALPPDAYFTAIDHGRLGRGKSGIAAGAARKRRGVKAGIPDWLIVWRGVTLWIERKVNAGVSTEQKLARDALRANGHLWVLARTLDDIEAALVAAGIPLRATAGGIRERVAAARARPKVKSRAKKAEPRFVAGKRLMGRMRKAGILI